MEYESSAGIIVYCTSSGKREYLLLQYASGHWDYAKGHIESGETKKDAALRELYEETGIKVVEFAQNFEQSFDYVFTNVKTKTLTHKTVYFFIGSVKNKEVILSKEHNDYLWLDYEKALEKLTYKNAKTILENAESYLNQHFEK